MDACSVLLKKTPSLGEGDSGLKAGRPLDVQIERRHHRSE